MIRNEFANHVGFLPTIEEYKRIEAEYMSSPFQKDEFCSRWLEDGGMVKLLDARYERILELEAELRKAKQQLEESDRVLLALDEARRALNEVL